MFICCKGLPPGTPIAVNAVPTGQPAVGGQQQAAPQAIYRIPTGPGGQMGQLVSIAGQQSLMYIELITTKLMYNTPYPL